VLGERVLGREGPHRLDALCEVAEMNQMLNRAASRRGRAIRMSPR